MQLILRKYGLFLYNFDAAAVENEGKRSSFCSSLRRSLKFRDNTAPSDAAPDGENAAHLQLIWTSTGSTLIRDVGERGKQGNVEQSRSPTKPIGIVDMFTIRS